MYEVEVKVPAEHDTVRERLRKQGAESLGKVTQEDTYYDAPHRDFAQTDEAVRIRRERTTGPDGGASREVITYKGPKIDDRSKTREEIEVGIASGEDVDALLQALGFEVAAVVEKERDQYRLEEYAVVLDDVDGVGEYVEVEIESEDVDTARNGANEILAELGLDAEEQVRTSYLGLLLGESEE